MKQITYILLGAAGLILTGCSQDDLKVGNDNGDGTSNVALNINLPELQTRAYGDGTTATKLMYAVYEVKGSGASETLSMVSKDNLDYAKLSKTDAEDINISKVKNFVLLNDRTYRFVFWAESAGDNPYTVTWTDNGASLATNYKAANGSDNNPAVLANDENLDAFYGVADLTVKGHVQMDVPLYRPFAQINVGTDDRQKASDLGYDVKKSTMVVKGYKTMNLLTGDCGTSQTYSATFNLNDIPSYDKTDSSYEAFPVEGYDYLSMAYVLIPKDQENIDVEFDYVDATESTGTHVRKVSNVPVQRNHRTNIYGQILTGNAELTVHIEPIFTPDDYEPNPLDLVAAIGGTVVLEDNVTLSKVVNFQKDAIVDMNGQKVTSPSTGTAADDGSFTAVNGSNIVIKGNGTMETAGSYASIMVWADQGSTITIEDGTYISHSTNNDPLIYIGAEGGTIYIKGGVFKSDDATSNRMLLNCYDAAYKSGKAKFIVTGGTFYGFDPANSASENPQANFVAPGYKSVLAGEENGKKIYTVVPESVDAVASDTQSLNSAIQEAGEEAHIVLLNGEYSLKDLDLKNAKFLTIEGSGDETKLSFLTTKNNMPCLQFGSLDLNLKNVTIKNDNNQNYNGFQVNTMVCENVTVDGVLFGYAYKGETYNNCKFVQNNPSSYNVWTYTAYPMVFNNCEFYTVDGRGINLYNDGGDKVVSINNCKFYSQNLSTGKAAIEIKVNSNADVTINNCTAEGFAEGSQSKNTLWNVPLNEYKQTLKLTVDGEEITIQK